MTRLRSLIAGLGCAGLVALAPPPGVAAPAQPPAAPAAAPGPAASADGERAAFIDGLMSAYMRDNDLQNAVVAVVRDGRVVFARGYGEADRAAHRPVDPAASLFRIGSTSKLFTWTAVMQLVERGQVDLDADVNTYLKGVRIPPAFGRPVTLRALMTHTAGFEDGAAGYLSTFDPHPDRSIAHAMAAHMPRRVRPPATIPAYSNYGAALAGLVVEQVSGAPFDDYVRRNIFDPLGMRNTTFEEPLPPRLAALQTLPYVRENGLLTPKPIETIAGFRPAGSVAASGLDMTRFMLACLQDGELDGARILKPETARLMLGTAFQTDPRLPGMALGFYESRINGVRLVGHGGATDAFLTSLMLAPDQRLGVFISYAGSDSAIHRRFIKSFFDRFYPAAPPPIPPAPREAVAQMDAYPGAYRSSRRSTTKIDKFLDVFSQYEVTRTGPDRLLVKGLGPVPELYAPLGEGLFQQVDGDRQIVFKGARGGKATFFATSAAPYWVAERTPWNENVGLWWLVLAASALVLLSAPIDAYAHRARLRALAKSERAVLVLSRAVSGLGLAAILAVGVALAASADHLEQTIPTVLKGALLLPPALAVVTAAAAIVTATAWRRATFGAGRRTYLILVLAAGAGVALFFQQWNLMGWRFG